MKTKKSLIPLFRAVSIICTIICSPVATIAQTTTTWTGAESNDWTDPLNWTDGVPDDTKTAVFNGGGEIALPNSVELTIKGIVFTEDATASVLLKRTSGDFFNFAPGDAIVVEAGSGSHTIQNNSSGTSYFRFAPGQDSYIRNYSTDSTLTLIGRFTRTASGTPRLHFDGSGDILITGTGSLFDSALGTVFMDATMTGRLIFDTDVVLATQGAFTMNGGTLVLDGAIGNRGSGGNGAGFFVNSGAIVTGNGVIGRDGGGSHRRDIQINNGGIVNAGRIGEVGTLTFRNNPVYFNEGSIMAFDLLNKDSHDQFVFELDGTGTMNTLPVLYLDDTILQINLLDGFSANEGDTFIILTGYDSLEGTFAGLNDMDIIEVGSYTFQIHYGASATTLQYVVIPEAETVALLIGIFALFGYRVSRQRG